VFQDFVDVKTKTVDGKKVRYVTRIPIDQWDKYKAEPDVEPEP